MDMLKISSNNRLTDNSTKTKLEEMLKEMKIELSNINV